MKLYSNNDNYKLYQGNMLEMLEVIKPNTIDSIVTDPPYELNFMGKGWDNSGIAFQPDTWKKCYEVLKSGGYLLAFGGSRTFHRIACAIEDAGFEIRDTIMWLYGSGFPKSMDISKSLDKRNGRTNNDFIEFGKYLNDEMIKKNITTIKLAEIGKFYANVNHGGSVSNWLNGKNVPTMEQYKVLKETLSLNDRFDYLIEREEAEREIIGKYKGAVQTGITKGFNSSISDEFGRTEVNITVPSTDLAKQWQGWGTALKPSFEPIIVARKPFKGSLVDNVIEYGVGGINIDECRVAFNGDKWKNQKSGLTAKAFNLNEQQREAGTGVLAGYECEANENGRFPANTILTYDETPSDERLRYFYCAKASKKDRDEGLDEFEDKNMRLEQNRKIHSAGCEYIENGKLKQNPHLQSSTKKNIHPTVKPTELMQYLVRLVTPNNGTILDPFNGSGSTGKAVMYENKERNKNYKYIGIELTEEYLPIAKARIEYVCNLTQEELKEKQMTIFDILESKGK